MKYLNRLLALTLAGLLLLQAGPLLPVRADEPMITASEETTEPAADPEDPGDPEDPAAPTGPADPTAPAAPTPAMDPMDRFLVDAEQVRCTFSDVPETAWYYPYVAYGQTLGIISGKTADHFAPGANMTVAEALTLAVRIYEIYHDQTTEHKAEAGQSWYTPYVDCAKAYGILPEGIENYRDPITRDQAAAVFTRILPAEEMEPINRVNRLPDTDGSNPYFEDILTLYRTGIVRGKDEQGSYDPRGTATRAELVKILCGVINPDLRLRFHLMLGDMRVFSENLTGADVCPFRDVPNTSWYYECVNIQSRLGILSGVSADRFSPDGTVTYAQALKAAVEVYDRYYDMEPAEQPSRPWYANYVQRALDYGILVHPKDDYNTPAPRGDVILFLYRALPEKELTPINEIDGIPDVDPDSFYYPCAMAMYQAGILRGSDEAGTANLDRSIRRSELAALLTRLVLPQQRLSFTLNNKVVKAFEYGVSGSGRYPLEGWQIGDGANVMILSFAIHGWEDNWAADGAMLVQTADETKAYLERNYELVQNGDWTVYILRCLNPDGLYLGTTCNGPGRCTTTYYNTSGALVTGSGRGIDMNRCFPYSYKTRTDARNYNGTAPLQAKEARALASFVQKAKGSGKNILIDAHGWYGQIITNSGKGTVYDALYRQFPDSTYASLSGGSGYFSAWAGYELGYDACLFEFPVGVTSASAFSSMNCAGRYKSAIADLLQNYSHRGEKREAEMGPFVELNGN